MTRTETDHSGVGPTDRVDTPLVHELFTIHHMMMRIGDRLTAPHGLTGSRWMLLCALDRVGDGATISDLADEQMMSVQAISRMLGSMEDEGLVVRSTKSGMGRTVFISLTDRGRDSIEILRGLGVGFRQPFLEGLGPDEVERLERDLSRLIDNLRVFESDLSERRHDGTDNAETA